MSSLRVAIAGATGYAGEELLRLLLQHPYVQITHLAASAKWERPTPVSVVYPQFSTLDLPIEAFEPSRFAGSCDVAFLALPHGTAMQAMNFLLHTPGKRRVIDLSGDFRLVDEALYPKWYRFPHAEPKILKMQMVAYGLTEYYRKEIHEAQIIANPGCYATSILLAVLPLFRAKLVEDGRFIVDAKSGFSGAGRKPENSLSSPEIAENLRPYKVNEHQHMPEIIQELERVASQHAEMVFVPQVIPATRGLISMVYLRVKDAGAVEAAYRQAYPPEHTPFVRIKPGGLPQLRDVVKTNYCDIGFIHDAATGTLIVASALDNLTKGAAGQAVQNFNVMHGFPETTGLL
jgi:N-acetyl-gamma-glutamyl-phosphate reductase